MKPAWVTALPRVYETYRWKPVRITKARGIVQVTTNKEQFALKPILKGGERLVFLDRVLQYLQKQGYSHFLPWERTKYGDTFFHENGIAFYATPWFGKEWSREAAISDDTLVRSLAEIHHLTKNTYLNDNESELVKLATIADEWHAQTERMRSYAVSAQKREFASPFDKAFLASVDELEQAAIFAIKGLKHMSDKEEKQQFRRVFCHRRIHPFNLVFAGNNWKWIDYIHGGFDVPVHDVALYMQNFPIEAETEDDQRVEALHARLAAYETIFPLRLREKQLLCLFLAYPRNVLKLLDHYYQRQRTRDEMFLTERLEGTIRYFQVIKRFVKQLWPRRNASKKIKRLNT